MAGGCKQTYSKDGHVAAVMAGQVGAKRIQSNLVLEGGGIEVDGHGTAIVTESCVLNANRNPGVSTGNHCATQQEPKD